jgi:hypothetical protein
MSTFFGPLGQLTREAAYLKYQLPVDLADRDPAALDRMAREFQARVLRVHAPAMSKVADIVAELESAPTGTYDLQATTATLPEPDATVYRSVQAWREDLCAGNLFGEIDTGLGAGGWRSPTMRQKFSMAIFDTLTFSGWRAGGSLCRVLTEALPIQPVPEARYYRPRGWFNTPAFRAHARSLRVQYLEIAQEVIK